MPRVKRVLFSEVRCLRGKGREHGTMWPRAAGFCMWASGNIGSRWFGEHTGDDPHSHNPDFSQPGGQLSFLSFMGSISVAAGVN